MSLPALIALLEAMNHDELRDFIDYVEYHFLSLHVKGEGSRESFIKSVRGRRSGLPTGGFGFKGVVYVRTPKTVLKMRSKNQKEALMLIEKGEGNLLLTTFGDPNDFRQSEGSIAWALLRAKAPVRKTSSGNIQVKWQEFKEPVIDEEGEVVKDKDGKIVYITKSYPYLYFRYLSVHGNKDKTMQRYESFYIGSSDIEYEDRFYGGYAYRELAYLVWFTLQNHGELRRRKLKDGKIQEFRARPKGNDNPIAELEREIIACIEMRNNRPFIHHDKLESLQRQRTLGMWGEEG